MALSCAVIGALTFARPPGWFRPTDVVEQPLSASAATPTESEQTLTGASALATGEACPVVFVPIAEPWLGSCVPPSSFDSTVIGAAADAGSVGSGSDAGPGAVGVADPDASATAAAAAFCTACTVVCRSVEVDDDDDAAPAGMTPALTPAPIANRIPHVSTPMEANLFRLMSLLLLWRGYTPLQPLARSYPAKRQTPEVHAKVLKICDCTRAAPA